ncbi:MAG: hypothetical protein NZ531_03300 [Aquificaceae bacterium]|nr:hypothetical protein [Aquificaceae bacterium]
MQLKKLFEKNYLQGVPGIYPFTPENLMRIGLALCTYIKMQRNVEKPRLVAESIDFLTLCIGVGFMAGGGDMYSGGTEGDVRLRVEQGEDFKRVYLENIEDYEFRMIESILFSRYNMPRVAGEEVGNIWIHEKNP